MSAEGKGRDVYLFADPTVQALTVGELRKMIEDRHDREHVVVATGDPVTPFIPVRAIADSKDKAVLEL